jgi:hypothetical protein
MGIFVILKISPCPSFPKRGCKRVHSNVWRNFYYRG